MGRNVGGTGGGADKTPPQVIFGEVVEVVQYVV